MKVSNANREWWKENNREWCKKDKKIDQNTSLNKIFYVKKKKVMRLVKPVNYWGIVINTQSDLFDQICWIMEIYIFYIDYISVVCPESFRCQYTVWTPQLCAQIKKKLVQKNINYLIVSSVSICLYLLRHLI